MNDHRRGVPMVCLLVAAGVLGSCSSPAPATPNPSPRSQAGGLLRVVMPRDVAGSFSSFLLPPPDPSSGDLFPPTLDPHLDFWYDAAELLRCCLARTLLSTNGKSAEQGGALIHPDLALDLPDVSADGLTWTFRIKPGLHYAPPLASVEITSADFVRSFQRMLSPAMFGQGSLGFLFTDVVGAGPYSSGEASSIAGLETPDAHTLVIRLERPAGDLAARLANVAAVPIPPNPGRPEAPFGVADGHDDGYGRFLVSSGPYMIEGSDALDFSLLASQQSPVSGLRQGASITLVRNPAWDPLTDELHPAHPDRIEVYAVGSVEDAVAELDAGRAEMVVNETIAPAIPVDIVEAFRADPARGQVFVNEFDGVRGVAMNTAQPPFDDLHVRKAVALVLDRANLIELQGGPLAYRVARHLAPEVLVNNLLVDYRPYASAGDAGDLEAARAEMRQSAYDSDGDGVCDGTACSGLVAVSRDELTAVGEAVVADLAKLGITFEHRPLARDGWLDAFSDPTQKVALFPSIGWAKGYLSASEFFTGQFYSPYAVDAGRGNGTLVGASPEQLAGWGYAAIEVPNVDERTEACLPLVGAAQFECWAALDQHMVENVVAIVPFASELVTILVSPRVTDYSFDQLVAAPAFDQIVVRP